MLYLILDLPGAGVSLILWNTMLSIFKYFWPQPSSNAVCIVLRFQAFPTQPTQLFHSNVTAYFNMFCAAKAAKICTIVWDSSETLTDIFFDQPTTLCADR